MASSSLSKGIDTATGPKIPPATGQSLATVPSRVGSKKKPSAGQSGDRRRSRRRRRLTRRPDERLGALHGDRPDERADVGAGSAGSPMRIPARQFGDERLVVVDHRTVHEEPGRERAALPGMDVKLCTPTCAAKLEIGVVAHDQRDFPPSSRMSASTSAACAMIAAPTASEPVNETRSTRGSVVSIVPTSLPPVTTLTTPAGRLGFGDGIGEGQCQSGV